MPEIMPTLLNLFLLAFILCSTLVIGFSLAIQQIPCRRRAGQARPGLGCACVSPTRA